MSAELEKRAEEEAQRPAAEVIVSINHHLPPEASVLPKEESKWILS